MAAWITGIKSLGKEELSTYMLSSVPLLRKLASHSCLQLAVLFPWVFDVCGTSHWCCCCFQMSDRFLGFSTALHTAAQNGSSAVPEPEVLGWTVLAWGPEEDFLLWFSFVLVYSEGNYCAVNCWLLPFCMVGFPSCLLLVTRAHTHVANKSKLILKVVFWEELLCYFEILNYKIA